MGSGAMIQPLWTSADAAAATGGTAIGDWSVSGLSIDSREIVAGDLFVALTGEARDGHAFVSDAFARGAAAAMVSHRPDGLDPAAPLLVVDDTLDGLQALAAAARARAQAQVVAITGSVGKTSTKDMLAGMLRAQGRCHAAVRSFNNHWGVPLTLARMPAETDFAVLEIGMNHAGEIGPLSRLAQPDVAVITAVEAVHLEFFAGVEAIADAKAEIFEGLGADGIAVLNTDIALYARLDAAAGPRPRVSFGSTGDIALRAVRLSGDATVVEARIQGQPALFKIGAIGEHFARNACAALAAVVALGADPARAMLALAGFQAPAGRGAREQVLLGPSGVDGRIRLIDESFNANPASMRAAFAVLSAVEVEDGIGRVARGRRIAFLGDMLELGPSETGLHAALATAPEINGIDIVHCCGQRMRALHEAMEPPRRGHWFEDSRAMAARAARLVDAGDVVMVKGSKGSAMGPVLDAIRRLGDDPARTEDG
ncbi:MAG: UDP-N-acetylmuramoyl-tripeptide--D-alanyl-D-alanine ligase [Pseudomonadota bacterium]